jgi:hypothetical protein
MQGGFMHPHPRPALRYILVVLLIAALVVLFPISARSHLALAAMFASL